MHMSRSLLLRRWSANGAQSWPTLQNLDLSSNFLQVRTQQTHEAPPLLHVPHRRS